MGRKAKKHRQLPVFCNLNDCVVRAQRAAHTASSRGPEMTYAGGAHVTATPTRWRRSSVDVDGRTTALRTRAQTHRAHVCISLPSVYINHSTPGRRAEYCNERVCVSVFACLRSYLRNYTSDLYHIFMRVTFAFSALTLLVGRQDGHPACKKLSGCWRGYLSGARCRLARGPADATATHCLLLQ